MVRRAQALGTIVLAAALAVGISRVPRLLSRIELFRVQSFALEGERHLTLEEAVEAAGVPAQASVWDDPEPWKARLRSHPLVRDARVRRDLPSTLVFEVEERTPVALYPGPVLRPVDEAGRPLPLDPAERRLDLPVLRPTLVGGGGRELSPAELRSLAREVARMGRLEPALRVRISEAALGARGEVAILLDEPRLSFLFRPPLTARRLGEGLRALSDAADRRGAEEVRGIDLRFEDQVVIRTEGGAGGRAPDFH